MILEDRELDALADAIAERMIQRGATLPARTREWMDFEEALDYTSLNRSTFEKARAEGRIPTHQIDGKGTMVYRREELDAALGYAAPPSKLRKVPDAA